MCLTEALILLSFGRFINIRLLKIVDYHRDKRGNQFFTVGDLPNSQFFLVIYSFPPKTLIIFLVLLFIFTKSK